MPRFVILRHELPPDPPRASHWDLMLEQGGVLKTWSLCESPDAEGEVVAEALADHRLAYLDYEGQVSGGRGSVTRWDRGTFEIVCWTAGEIAIDLEGERLAGRVRMVRQAGDDHRWLVSIDKPRLTRGGR